MPGLDLPSLAILMRQPPNRPDPVSHLASGIQPCLWPILRIELRFSRRLSAVGAGQRLRKSGSSRRRSSRAWLVRLVARRHGVAPNQLFTWRRLFAQGALTGAGSGQEVVPA